MIINHVKLKVRANNLNIYLSNCLFQSFYIIVKNISLPNYSDIINAYSKNIYNNLY
jgi:hypothetical protein